MDSPGQGSSDGSPSFNLAVPAGGGAKKVFSRSSSLGKSRFVKDVFRGLV